MPIKETGNQTAQLHQVFVVSEYPIGLGFVGGQGEGVTFAAKGGPRIWEFENRRATVSQFLFHNLTTIPCAITGHPKLPVVLASSLGTHIGTRIEHVDGFLTLLPQQVGIPNASLQSAPVVMTIPNKAAFGGVNAVYLIKLDAEGRFLSEAESVVLNAPLLQALAYSEKFDRLYVAVEAVK